MTELARENDGRWRVEVADVASGDKQSAKAKFVFIGAGGDALLLLEKSGIPEGRGYGGFPVSGIWLRCDNPEVANRHHAKVYGKAAVGSPPMSVPHLDTRIIGGQRSLLFGPYAGFSTKFQKHGSLLDLLKSVRPGNVGPMLSVARDNLDLTEYLFEQVLQSEKVIGWLRSMNIIPRRTRATGSFRSLGSGCKSSSPTSGAEDCWSSEPSWSALRIARLSRF